MNDQDPTTWQLVGFCLFVLGPAIYWNIALLTGIRLSGVDRDLRTPSGWMRFNLGVIVLGTPLVLVIDMANTPDRSLSDRLILIVPTALLFFGWIFGVCLIIDDAKALLARIGIPGGSAETDPNSSEQQPAKRIDG